MPKPEIFCHPTDGPSLKFQSPDLGTTKELTIDNDGNLMIGDDPVGARTIEMLFEKTVDDTVYKRVGIFIFGGSTILGTPSKIKVVSSRSGQTVDYDIKLQDLTNALTIAEKIDITNLGPEIFDLGTLNNIPAAEAMWEFQIRATGGAENKGTIQSVSIEF